MPGDGPGDHAGAGAHGSSILPACNVFLLLYGARRRGAADAGMGCRCAGLYGVLTSRASGRGASPRKEDGGRLRGRGKRARCPLPQGTKRKTNKTREGTGIVWEFEGLFDQVSEGGPEEQMSFWKSIGKNHVLGLMLQWAGDSCNRRRKPARFSAI